MCIRDRFSNDDAYYYGDNAVNHCRKVIKGMRNNGVKILSYFIAENTYGQEKKWFEQMYGDDASFINPSNMMEVAKTMNKMFLSKWEIETIWGWGKNFSPAVYILINMKKTNNEALGELIDSLIEITIAPDTDEDISEQLEPIIEG